MYICTLLLFYVLPQESHKIDKLSAHIEELHDLQSQQQIHIQDFMHDMHNEFTKQSTCIAKAEAQIRVRRESFTMFVQQYAGNFGYVQPA